MILKTAFAPGLKRQFIVTMILMGTAGFSSIHAKAGQEPLPKAEQILDQFVQTLGGREALDRIRNRVVQASMEIAGAGVKLSMTLYTARPNKAYSIVESPATGKIETGTDGEVAWQLSDMTGAQVMTGKEKANALHMNIFDRPIRWREAFVKVETAGVEDVLGKPCYKVLVTPPDLPPQTWYFDKETHLLVRTSLTAETQAGTITADSYLSDYKPVDGILMAHKNVTRLMGQERISIINSVQQNVDLPADRFALPAAIQALIKK